MAPLRLTSSVKRVQYRIRPEALITEAKIIIKLVQQPTHAYIGKKGIVKKAHHLYRAAVKARVRPVGATNVIGWPARVAYAIPHSPREISTSGTPIAPLVRTAIVPPNASTGARHANQRNEIAARLFGVSPSRQSRQ